jgi:hypothetical protein
MPTTKAKSKQAVAPRRVSVAKKKALANKNSAPRKTSGGKMTSSKRGVLNKAKNALADVTSALVPAAKAGLAVGIAAAATTLAERAVDNKSQSDKKGVTRKTTLTQKNGAGKASRSAADKK